MKNLLIADIGGTNTRLYITDINNNVLYESVGYGVATATDEDLPILSLEEQIAELPEKQNVGAIAINLGGKNTNQVKKCFKKVFCDTPLEIFRESEGTAAYALGEEYNAPVVLMAGTGAIAVGKSNNGFVITGGWGINIGDDGSGYDIGLQAIRMSLKALDNTETLSPLTKFLCNCDQPISATENPVLYRDKRDIVRSKLYPFDRPNISSLSKTVFEFAKKGDKSALDILKYSGEKLAELVICTANKLSGEIPNVVVTGGLIHSREFWKEYFEKAVLDAIPNVKIYYVPDGLLKGTFKIAKDLYERGKIND
ncbi:MAG: hypothetical protein J6A69_10035 [Clostridia bacterium]|nr:hypothetical protein [Clostridia bacterium]